MNVKDQQTVTKNPDLHHAQKVSLIAHGIVVKFQEMGLPNDYDEELSSLSTAIGDIWGTQKSLSHLVDDLLNAPKDWEVVGDHIIDLKSVLDHVDWHLKSIRKPISKIARYAYRQSNISPTKPD